MASTVWRGFLTFGLISIPVRLFRAARAERVSFKRVYRASAAPEETDDGEAEPEPPPKPAKAPGPVLLKKGAPPPEPVPPPAPAPSAAAVYAPVQQAALRRDTGEVVQPGSVAKGFEVSKGQYVVIDPEELKSIAPKTATEMQIAEFVRLNEIDPVYFETSYYVVPEQAGEKAYGLLYRALQDAGLVALAQMAMHNREHVMVVRPGKLGLLAHTMFYETEVRGAEEHRADTSAVSEQELKLAHQLIGSLAGPFEPNKYRDTYREKLEAMIAAKQAGLPAPAEEERAPVTAVADITEMLQKSLAALKKAPASETEPAKPLAKSPKARRAGS